jgi:hypothetical protein
MSAALQATTTFADEVILSGENMLLTFTNIGRDVFPMATETMLDMSQALGQDVTASAMQLGKALNDPVAGITALTRVGVTFSEEQKAVIESLAATGVKALTAHLALVIATKTLASLIMGKGPQPDDGEDEASRWLNWFLRGLAVATFDPLPFGVGFEIETRLMGKQGSQRVLPMNAAADAFGRALGKAITAATGDEDPDVAESLMAAAKATGLAFGTPTRPLRGLKYLKDLADPESDVEARGPFDVVGGAIYGQHKAQPKNIPVMIQDLLSGPRE